jgi:hypothetical protein
MATDAEISANITAAQTLALTPAQMLALCDRATAELLLGKPKAAYTLGNTTFSFANLQTVNGVRDYYQQLVRIEDNGGMAVNLAEG